MSLAKRRAGVRGKGSKPMVASYSAAADCTRCVLWPEIRTADAASATCAAAWSCSVSPPPVPGAPRSPRRGTPLPARVPTTRSPSRWGSRNSPPAGRPRVAEAGPPRAGDEGPPRLGGHRAALHGGDGPEDDAVGRGPSAVGSQTTRTPPPSPPSSRIRGSAEGMRTGFGPASSTRTGPWTPGTREAFTGTARAPPRRRPATSAATPRQVGPARPPRRAVNRCGATRSRVVSAPPILGGMVALRAGDPDTEEHPREPSPARPPIRFRRRACHPPSASARAWPGRVRPGPRLTAVDALRGRASPATRAPSARQTPPAGRYRGCIRPAARTGRS